VIKAGIFFPVAGAALNRTRAIKVRGGRVFKHDRLRAERRQFGLSRPDRAFN
jgi:hypothetical protein